MNDNDYTVQEPISPEAEAQIRAEQHEQQMRNMADDQNRSNL